MRVNSTKHLSAYTHRKADTSVSAAFRVLARQECLRIDEPKAAPKQQLAASGNKSSTAQTERVTLLIPK